MKKSTKCPSNMGLQKYNEALELGLPQWVAVFARQIYNGEPPMPQPVKPKFDKQKFEEQWDKEMEQMQKELTEFGTFLNTASINPTN